MAQTSRDTTRHHRLMPRRLRRCPTVRIPRNVRAVVAAMLIASLAAPGVPLSASPAKPVEESLLGKPLPEPVVTVNRTVPKVEAPPIEPRFSRRPTAAEVTRARVFTEPLVPVGGVPTVVENRALAEAVLLFHRSGGSDWRSTFGAFLSAHPRSPWRAAVLGNIASLQLRDHEHSAALASLDEAWTLAKDATDRAGQAVADLAVADWLGLAASFGQVVAVNTRLAALETRSINGVAATRISRAKEAIALIRSRPDLLLYCGPEAIWALIRAKRGEQAIKPRALASNPARRSEMTLREMVVLSGQVGLRVSAMSYAGASELPVPSIVHWKIGHYATIMERRGNRYRVVDGARKQDYWLSLESVLSESSGYFLAEAPHIGREWTAVPRNVAQSIKGSGPLCLDGSAPKAPPCGDGCGSGGNGMAVYQFQPVTASLLLRDNPLGYEAAKGPTVSFALTYHQREMLQPQTFSHSNLGPKWTMEWLRFVKEEPTDSLGVTPPHTWVAIPPGGREVFVNPDSSGVFPAHWFNGAVLVRTSTSPIRYERRLPDGTVEEFAHSDGGPAGSRRIFLTRIVDPRGSALTLTWDSQNRLVAIADALNQVSTIEYELSDGLKISGISDPFGRTASFSYNSLGQLDSITDVIGLQSRFAYGDGDFVSTLRTPYGITSFQTETPAINSMYTERFIQATDPLGATERLEWHFDSSTLPATESVVPTGFANWNERLNLRNSIYWDKLAWSRGPGDVSKATITHWLEQAEWQGWQIYAQPVAHSIQRPLERRVWFAYPGQPAGQEWYGGSLSKPSRIGRVLPDGSSQIWATTYNEQGFPLLETDPQGRTNTFTYASNGRDLLSVVVGGAETVATYSDYVLGRPSSAVGASGGETLYTYNEFGQVETITDPMGRVTSYAYDSMGRVENVSGPASGAVVEFIYDAIGRTRTISTTDGDTTTDYDAFDRPIQITYPDGTMKKFTYDRLDLATSTDRSGRTTRYFYDNLRRPTTIRDPLGRSSTQNWCSCGLIDSVQDARQQVTRWERDVQGRVVREIRADGVTATEWAYDSAGRLVSTTDAKGQVTTVAYTLDNKTASIVFTNAEISTPSISYEYDSVHARRISMTDGSGTTSYGYVPLGEPGSGSIAEIDGPLDDDTITITYDADGRAVRVQINGSANESEWEFDALDRVETARNALGEFNYQYDGVSDRLSKVDYPNGQSTQFTYFGGAADRRLQTIHHKRPGGATLSKFDYTYDAVGNVASWLQTMDVDESVLWRYARDAADQLIRATKYSTGTTPEVLSERGYLYDRAGNRTVEHVDGRVVGATYNVLNQLVSQSVGGMIAVTGRVSEPSVVKIDGKPATVDAAGDFVGQVSVADGSNTFEVEATDASGNAALQEYSFSVGGDARAFAYDANGSMTSDGARTFTWDAKNRLRTVAIGDAVTYFSYDGNDRRVRSQHVVNGITVSDRRFVWVGYTLAEERNASNEVVERMFSTGRIRNGVAEFVVRDHLGSPTETTDEFGELLSESRYDPFGRATVSGSGNAEGFSGHRVSEADSNLLLAPLRAYDVSLGRWTSEDPAGLSAGANLYRYVANSPVDFADPLGLVQVRHAAIDLVIEYGNFDQQCASPKNPTGRNAGACASVGAAAFGHCEEERQSNCTTKFRAKEILMLFGKVHVYNGQWPYLGRRPGRDKSVVDFNSALAHEFQVHILPAMRAALKILEKLESRQFNTKEQCDAARGAEQLKATKAYWSTLAATQFWDN